MATPENEIGKCRCPVCDSTKASLRLSSKQLVYVTCNTCNCQVFARSDRSDEKLRALLIAEPASPDPAPAPVSPAVKTLIAAALSPAPAEAPTPAPKPAPTPAPAPAPMGWGAFPFLR